MSDAGLRVQGQLAEAWALLEASRPREAADLFGRILLQDPSAAEARRGLGLARARTGELERELEARLDEARSAAEAGEVDRSRALLEEVIHQGGDRDRARELLDRLDLRGGLVAAPLAGEPPLPAAAAVGPAGDPPPGWSRTAFATVAAVAFAAVATGVAASWERLVLRLERRPSPAAYALSASPLPAPSRGEQAVSEAQRRIQQGDLGGALRVLQDVAPEDPVYPFALQLRERATGAASSPATGLLPGGARP